MGSPLLHQMILASSSPRRKMLLSYWPIAFEVIVPDVEEVSEDQNPSRYVQNIAALKGREVLRLLASRRTKDPHFSPVILAADTTVVLKDKIYVKPTDIQEARSMLLELSGQTHEVYTGIYLGVTKGEELEEKHLAVKTSVTFASLKKDSQLLERYLQSGDSLDKAGAYGLQNGAQAFITRMDGSYTNVIGLPLSHIQELLLPLTWKDFVPIS